MSPAEVVSVAVSLNQVVIRSSVCCWFYDDLTVIFLL